MIIQQRQLNLFTLPLVSASKITRTSSGLPNLLGGFVIEDEPRIVTALILLTACSTMQVNAKLTTPTGF